MYEIWIEEDGREHHRQSLSEGTFRLGRLAENEIYVPDHNVSRHHLRLDVSAGEVMVTDLGSTNGTQLNGRQLTPHESTYWPAHDSLRIGPLRVHLRHIDEPATPAVTPAPAMPAAVAAPAGPLVATIVCREAVPPIYNLALGAVFVGSAPTCAIRLVTAGVAPNHCQIVFNNNQAQVINLDASRPATLAGKPLPANQPQAWQPGQPLQIGGATLYVSLAPAGSAPYQHVPAGRPARRGRWWRYAMGVMVLAAVGFVCVSLSAIVGAWQAGCSGLDPACILAALDSGGTPGNQTPGPVGPGTPTLAPRQTPGAAPTRTPSVIDFGRDTPSPTPSISCETVPSAEVITAGWLDLPFPYNGTAEQFRRISQRSRFGGRINSFFDHEYPVYPPSVNGLEPLDPITVTASLVIFDGSRSVDAYMDATDGDWYSGHSGIDFSAENALREDTPVLAAADGFLYLAKIDNDGNHMVWIEHDPDGDNRNKYMTLYFHLKPDQFFEQRVAQYALVDGADERVAIAAGERIGTMGTTGRSSGIHLHFEVRYDANGDRIYSRFERVDPYGFFPSEEIPVDPWSVALTWMDNKQIEQEHDGIASPYLWEHPLVDVEAEAGEVICAQEVNVQVDLYPIVGWAVVDPGFTNIIHNEQGEVIDVGEMERRELTILPADVAFVDLETLSLEFLPPGGDPQRDWRTIPPRQTELIARPNGGYTFRVEINQTGRYVVVGRQTRDLVPPVVIINLDGTATGEANTFEDSVTVTLIDSDFGYPAPSGVREVQYSLDCGTNWIVYDGNPLTFTKDTPHSCGESGVGEQGVQYGENEFLLLAIATDFNDNVQQPASQVIFTIE